MADDKTTAIIIDGNVSIRGVITEKKPFPCRTWPWRWEDDNDQEALAERARRRANNEE